MVASIILTIIYYLIFFPAVIGNSLFLAAVRRNVKLHTAVFILLANEALSDLLFILLSLFNGAQSLFKQWLFGDVFCRLQVALINMSFTISCLSLSAVAVERYKSICFATKQTRRTNKWTLKACFIIWCMSFVVSSPLLYFYRLYPIEKLDKKMTNRTKNSTHLCQSGSKHNVVQAYRITIYHSIQYFLIYLTPLLVLIYTHSKIIFTLKRSTKNKSQSARTSHSQQMAFKEHMRNKKTSKLLTVTTIVFFVLWTPYVAVRLIRSIVTISQLLIEVVYMCVLVSTVTNFFITFSMSKEFRQTVKGLLKMKHRRISNKPRSATTLSTVSELHRIPTNVEASTK